MSRPKIQTTDVGMQDPVHVQLDLGTDADDLAIVTEESMQSPHVKEYARELAFMEDEITFTIMKSDAPNAIDPVECAVNGVQKKFYRGMQYKAARKFLNALINVCFNVETVNRKDPNTGLDKTEVVRTPYTPYVISVMHDPSPIGAKWLEFKMNGDTYVKH